MSTLNAKVILNVKTAAEWANSTEILLEGELGIESDTRLIKVGNGVDTYISLPYTAASDINDIEGVTVTSPTDGNVLTYSNGEWVNITPSSLPADTDLSHYDNSTSGFITASDIPALPADTDLSQYDNTNSDFATVSQIPTDVSQLNNDAGYITSASIPSVGDGTITIQKNSVNVDSFTTNQNTNKTINITVPTLLSELSNDVGYITSATLPTVNDATLTIQRNGTTVGTFTANAATNSTINISVPTSFSDITSAGDLLPSIDVTYNLGSSSYRWNTLYVCNIYGGGSSIEIDGNVYPKTDVTDALGGSYNRWREIYGKELYIDQFNANSGNTSVNFAATVLPKTGDYYSLGGSSYHWNSIYANYIHLSTLNPYYIDANNTYVTLKANTATVAYLGHYNSISGIFPANNGLSGGAECLGQVNRYWYAGYFANVWSPKHHIAEYSSIEQSSNNTYDIDIKWRHYSSLTDNVWTLRGNTLYINVADRFNLGYTEDQRFNSVYSRQYALSNNTYVKEYNSTSDPGISLGWKSMGTSGSSYELLLYHTYCMPSVTNAVDLGGTNNRWKTIYTNNSVNVSDKRSKDNIEDLENGLDKVNTIVVKSFTMTNHDEGVMYGFIAQDELKRNPELVVVPDDYSEDESGGELGFMPNNVLFLAVKAIQELSSKVDELNAKIKVLEAKL